MQIILDYNELYGVMERSLSIIAKRSVDDQGSPIYDNITLGSREKELAYDFFRTAIVALAADMRMYVTLESSTTTSYTITINLYPDTNVSLENTIRQAVKDYIVAYALYSWFTVTSPRLTEKYQADAESQRRYIISQVFHRQRPASMPDPLAPKTDPRDQ